jgi:hypothetical protein
MVGLHMLDQSFENGPDLAIRVVEDVPDAYGEADLQIAVFSAEWFPEILC